MSMFSRLNHGGVEDSSWGRGMYIRVRNGLAVRNIANSVMTGGSGQGGPTADA